MILTMIVTTIVLFLLACIFCILFGEDLVVTLAERLEMDDCRPLLIPVFMFFMVLSGHIARLLSLIFFK